jgi:hypothetical protein
MTPRRLALVLALVLVAAGCGSAGPPPAPAITAPAGPCGPPASYLAKGRPDPCLTPGDTDPKVTQANIHQTICVAGYSRRHRPPAQLTDRLKVQVARAYGIRPFAPRAYEGDHLIPISIGGNPEADGTTRNFWDEPRGGAASAADKDGLEFYLYKAVCSGRVPLAQAQREIASDWMAAWVKYGRPKG